MTKPNSFIAQPKNVAADVRMANHSGIGRYIRETMPRVRALFPEVKWRWVGYTPEPWMCLDASDTEYIPWHAPVYSLREHFSTPAVLDDADLCWVPHYNVTAKGHAGLVTTIHDILPLRRITGFRGWIRSMAFRGYWRRITTRAGLVLTVSEFTASEMRQIGGLNPDRICVTPLGVDSRRFGEEAPDVGGDGFLYVGNIKPHKNLMKLLDAWEHVAPQVEGNLCIVGRRDGFFTSDRKIQRRIRSLGSRVEFSGEVDDLTLAAYYRKATALVLPSLYEGFGLPVLEAMSLGCPVIAANTSALPETGGAAALYFPPLDQNALAECMLRLASNSALRVQMREAGLIRARQYTWDRTAEFTAAAFRRLLG